MNIASTFKLQIQKRSSKPGSKWQDISHDEAADELFDLYPDVEDAIKTLKAHDITHNFFEYREVTR